MSEAAIPAFTSLPITLPPRVGHCPLCGSELHKKLVPRQLTKRQHGALKFIARFIKTNGYSPSFEEIGRGLGVRSLATVHKHIGCLKRKGYINQEHNCSRSIVVIDFGPLKKSMA